MTSGATPSVSYGYDEYGARTSMTTSGVGSTSYSYNSYHQLSSETANLTGYGSVTLSYQYNYVGALTKATYTVGAWVKNVNYAYNYAGSLIGTGTDLISGGGSTNSTNVINTLNYRGFGGVKSLNFGNTRRMEAGYSVDRQQLTSLVVKKQDGSDTIINQTYDYYNGGANNGRIQKITDNVDSAYTTTYAYDAYNRLQSATAAAYTRNYAYDNWGNLTGVTASGAGETGSYSLSYAANGTGAPATNRISNAGFGYDNAGNLTSGDWQTYTYDAANRLKAVGASGNTYVYDGDGRKVAQNTGGYGNVYYIWSSVLGQPALEVTSGGVYRAYVYGPSGQRLGVLSYDGGFYWVHSDHLGSGRKLTDVNGNVVYRGEFDPHGQAVYEWASGGATYLNSHKFTGYERNWATNLDDANARTYNHNRGRFMQPDPLGLGAADLTNPQSLNRYSYVQNDPVNFIDPTGLLLALTTCHTEVSTVCFGGDCQTFVTTSCSTEFFNIGDGVSVSGGGGGTIDSGDSAGGGGGGTQQNPNSEKGPACGFLNSPSVVSNAARTAGEAAESAGGATVLLRLLGVIGLLLSLESTMGPDDTGKPITVYRHAKALNPGEFKPEGGLVSTWEHMNPDRKYNVPFNGMYIGKKAPGTIAVIQGVHEVPGLTAVYSPTPPNGPGHWDLIQPAGMSDEAFKKGLSDYAKRIFQGCK